MICIYKNNRKGFTMTELLVTITIIGVLSFIAMVSILRLREKEREKFNLSQNQIFVQMGKTYFIDNKQKLPMVPYEKKIVTLGELINKNYIDDDFVDYDQNKFKNSSKVTVVRNCNGKYAYYGKLITKDDKEYEIPNTDSNITISYKNANLYKNKYYTNKNPMITVKMSDEDMISSYQYVIYRNGKVLKKSGINCLNLIDNDYSDTILLDIDNFTSSLYKVKIILYDVNGYKKEIMSKDIIFDNVKPTCSLSYTGKIGENGWYKTTGNVNINVNDNNVIGITKGISTRNVPNYTVSSVQQKDTKGIIWYGFVKDAAGNTNTCSKYFKVDSVAPVIKSFVVSSTEKGYNNLNAIATVDVIDSNSIRYDVSINNYSNGSYGDMRYYFPDTKSVSLNYGSSYDGSIKKNYLTVKDAAGNVSYKQIDYRLYKLCSQITKTETRYGTCSKTCGGGTQSKTIYEKDKYLGGICKQYNDVKSCNTQACCTGPTYIYGPWSSCSKLCNTGTKKRVIDVHYCDGSLDTKEETQYCNTQPCCKDIVEKPCSVKCGIGTIEKLSAYNGKKCGSESCIVTKCKKNSYYIGKTLMSVERIIGRPTIGNGNCPSSKTGYALYYSDGARLYSRMSSKKLNATWGCPNNNVNTKKVGDKVTIDREYTVIKDSVSLMEEASKK